MTFTVAAMVRQFHTHLGDRLPTQPEPPSDETNNRQGFIEDEVDELRAAWWSSGDPVEIAQELADVVYVAYGTAVRLGIPLDAVIAEVHRANMTKDPGLDGGKAIKGARFQPADVAAILGLVEPAP